ncbi:MAG: ATP-binding cassette domain-containing protein, partial [Victivallaceae bacterium]
AMPENMPTSSLMAILGSFGFSGDSAHKLCKVLSGGEKIRLCFARIFVNPPNLLILDEPTTHLDIAAREALQEALKNYQGTVCLVSHDIEFVRNAATSIIAMCSPGIRKYFGNYDYYREKSSTEGSAVEQNDGEAEVATDSIKDRRRDRAKKRQELHDSKKSSEKTVNELERKLEKLEAEQTVLLEKMNTGGNIDFEDFNRNLQRIRKEIEEATAAWEIAAEELEEILRLNAEIHS